MEFEQENVKNIFLSKNGNFFKLLPKLTLIGHSGNSLPKCEQTRLWIKFFLDLKPFDFRKTQTIIVNHEKNCEQKDK